MFPRSKVSTFVELVVVDQFGIRPLCPTARAQIDLVRKGAYGNRDGDAFDIEIPEFAEILPIEAGSEIAVFVNQVIVMLSRMSSRVRPSDSPSKTR